MNRHAIISAIAIAVIAAPLAYSGASIFGAYGLEYRWADPGGFSFFALSNHGEMEICNTLPFWTSFSGIKIDAYYDAIHRGTFSTGPATLEPLGSSTLDGTFRSDGLAASQHIFMTMDHEFAGGPIRLDPDRFIIVRSVDVPILGLVPYTVSSQVSGFDFGRMMGAPAC